MITTEIIKAIFGGIFYLSGVWLKHRLENPPQSRAGTASINIGAVIRDVGIIWILTALPSFIDTFIPNFIAGFNAGVKFHKAVPVSPVSPMVPLSSLLPISFVLAVIGFVISGSQAQRSRWKHLFAVAIVTWLSALLNVILGYYSPDEWFKSIFGILLIMSIGGVISYVFKRR